MNHSDPHIKPLTRDGVAAALRKAEQYRVLNEPIDAESICLDVLAIEPDNDTAKVLHVLTITDQFIAGHVADLERAKVAASGLEDGYSRAYYSGVICERWAKALIRGSGPHVGAMGHQWISQALDWYAKAEALRPEGNEDPILRWNTCQRIIQRDSRIKPQEVEEWEPSLE